MKVWRILAGLALLILLTAALPGCLPKQAAPATTADKPFLTVADDAGRTISLRKKPERIVLLSSSLLDLFYHAGGQAVGRADANTIELPPHAQALPSLGFGNTVNLEKLISLQPDLVIAPQGVGERYAPLLESNRIPVLLLRLKNFDDVRKKLQLFGDIAGTRQQADQIIANLELKMNKLVDSLPAQTKKVVILHATAKSITVELESSIAGDIAKRLRLQNIAAGSQKLDSNWNMTPYSMEKLVESDPDIVMITVMGNKEAIERRMQADVESSPAWANLRAVKNRQVYFLPPEYFLLNPGFRYDQAMEYMAKIVYPEVYGHAK